MINATLLVSPGCCNKLLWTQWLKQHIFIISWFQGSGIQAQLNCTPVRSHKAAIKVWPGLGCHWDSIRERIYFQAHLDYWENSFPWGPWFLAGSSLEPDKRPLQFLAMWSSYSMAAHFFKASRRIFFLSVRDGFLHNCNHDNDYPIALSI